MKRQTPQPAAIPAIPAIPAKPVHDVPSTERERAENEGMTVKPNRDATNRDDVKIGKAHVQVPAASPARPPARPQPVRKHEKHEKLEPRPA